MKVLAICGGPPVVSSPHPHADRARFTAADQNAISAYLSNKSNPNSYFGRDGLLREYEDELASFFSRRYCILTNSGTSALHTAFFSAGIEPGDEIIAPTYTFHATVTPAFQLGAVVVLADAELDTGNIVPIDVERKITDRTKAIVVTHQYGHPVDGPALRDIAQQHNLVLIEDVSLAIGSTLDESMAGTFGDIACLSLGSTKLLSGGQGGALVLDDTTMWERGNLLGHFALRCYDTVEAPLLRQFADTGYGHNYRMHVLSIAVSLSRFHQRDELIGARHQRYNLLSTRLAETKVIEPPITRRGVTRGSWQGYCALYQAETTGVPIDMFVKALRAEGLEVSARGYHPPLHWSRIFQTRQDGLRSSVPYAKNRRTYRRGDFPQAEAHVKNLIGFPLFLDEDLQLIEEYGRACQKVVDYIDVLQG